jgi:hypothetical protein
MIKYDNSWKNYDGLCDALQGSLMGSNVSMKWKTSEEQGVKARSLACNTLGVKGMLELQDGTRESDKHLITRTDPHKLNNKFVNA